MPDANPTPYPPILLIKICIPDFLKINMYNLDWKIKIKH